MIYRFVSYSKKSYSSGHLGRPSVLRICITTQPCFSLELNWGVKYKTRKLRSPVRIHAALIHIDSTDVGRQRH